MGGAGGDPHPQGGALGCDDPASGCAEAVLDTVMTCEDPDGIRAAPGSSWSTTVQGSVEGTCSIQGPVLRVGLWPIGTTGDPQLHVALFDFQGEGTYLVQDQPNGHGTALSLQGFGGPTDPQEPLHSAVASPCTPPCVAEVVEFQNADAAFRSFEMILQCDELSTGLPASGCVTCSLSDPFLRVRAACVTW